MKFNPLNIFRPRTEAEAAASVKNVQPGKLGFGAQVVETIGTIATAIGRTFGTTVTAPLAPIEGGVNAFGRGLEATARPFFAFGKIVNTTRTKMYNLFGGKWFK